MGCGCNEQHNSNCFCQCEDLPVPQGPTGLQGIQGPTGAAGAAGASGADGADAFNAQLTSGAVAINLADTTGAFAGIPPTAYKYYNDTITTVFSLTEGGVPVAIDVANMALSYGGEVNLATVANVAGGIELTLVRGLNTPTSNYGYVDMTYTHGALTFVKRFNVVYVHDGDTFLVGEDDPTAVTDPIEGNTLVTKAGQLMKYQGGAWIQILDIHQTTTKAVVLTGALYTLNLTSTSERIISLTGSGTVNNNITIALPVAGCTAGTEFTVLYNASMKNGTGTMTILNKVIPTDSYTVSFTVHAYFNGSTWITCFYTNKAVPDVYEVTVAVDNATSKTLKATPLDILLFAPFGTNVTLVPIQAVVHKIGSAGTFTTHGSIVLKQYGGSVADYCVIMSDTVLMSGEGGVAWAITPISMETIHSIVDTEWQLSTLTEHSGTEDSTYNVSILYRVLYMF